jgi:cellulose biosynthesis protein BcsQ
LLIDIDAQCSLTIAVGLDPEQQSLSGQNVYNLVTPQAWPNIHNLRISNHIRAVPGLPAPLYILPGGFNVEDLDIEIVEAIASQRERSKNEFFLYCRQLICSLNDYEYVLIDCPPNKMYLTQGMLRASSYFLPVTIPDRISIYGMPRLLRWVSEIENQERPRMLGYVLNAVNRTGGSPTGMVISQQAAAHELETNLLARLSRYERVIMADSPSLGAVPRLDAIARFLGDQKEVHLDFARRTSGQPDIDRCLTLIANNVLGRMQRYAP